MSTYNFTGQPWYTFSWLENFGTIDPQGNYWKPDVNVQAPGQYPITSLFSGTVTSVQQTSWGQNVVTVKLDNALNYLATHVAYQHLSSSSVQVGQHVSTGSLIGFNNNSGQVPVGLSFYSGDIYGSGSAWNTLQQDLAPGGAGLLNPGKLLGVPEGGYLRSNLQGLPDVSGSGGATSSGAPGPQGTTNLSSVGGGTTSSTSGGCQWYDIGCQLTGFFQSDFFTQSAIVTVAVLLGLIGVIVLVFGHGSEQGAQPTPVPA